MFKIYNTLTHEVQAFEPLKNERVGIYVCGPTVYNPSHIGHGRTWIFFDWLRRYLAYKGLKVKFVQNITDVGHLVGDAEAGEDKIEKEALKQGKTPAEIARAYEADYFKDLERLNILKPDCSPRASEHIKEMIAFIEVLIRKGFAYESNGNVYFEVAKFPAYGELSGRKVADEREGTRVESDKNKKDQADFSLWLKADENHLQKWPSPWSLSRAESRGEGYPGWHLECSVMAAKYLGQPFDLHGSASEHIFPHHENEIAQSTAFAGKPLARYFVHSGMLLIDSKKMSKSLGNFVTIEEVVQKYSSDMVKLAFMATFWRKPYDWTESALQEARKTLDKLERAKAGAGTGKSEFKAKLEAVLDDDFNAPKTLTLILENLNKLTKDDFEVIEKVFGLELKTEVEISPEDQELVKKRDEARKKGDYKESDRIRRALEEKGIGLEDTPEGVKISKMS